MDVVLVTHPSSLLHDAGWGHPERPERIEAAVAGVRSSGLDVTELTADPAGSGALQRVHDERYVSMIERFCAAGGGRLDADTRVVADSWEAAIHSAGAGLTALAALSGRPDAAAFVATRPPGHHALRDTAMGFCIFNNIAVAASSLREAGRRVAIVDWDVHHGNGTQAMFYDDPGLLYVSLHQWPFYPLTGSIDEVGSGPGEGTTVNVPWPAGTGGAAYHDAMRRLVLPIIDEFAPDDLLVSAGYDAHRDDPLAGLRLEAPDYGAMAAALRDRLGGIRTVFFLEGGYDLAAIADSVSETLRGTAGGVEIPASGSPSARCAEIVDSMAVRFAHWYDALR